MQRVRDFLESRGVAAHVIDGGVARLIGNWERTAEEYAQGYDDDIMELLNDLDGRQILADVLGEVADPVTEEERRRIAAADATVRAHATFDGPCLWKDVNARRHGWTRETNWWYFARPTSPGEDLAREPDRL